MEHPENIETLLTQITNASNNNESFNVLKDIILNKPTLLVNDFKSIECIDYLEQAATTSSIKDFQDLMHKAYNIYHYQEITYSEQYKAASKKASFNGAKLYAKDWIESKDIFMVKDWELGRIFERLRQSGYCKGDYQFNDLDKHPDLELIDLNAKIIAEVLYKAKVFDITVSVNTLKKSNKSAILSALNEIPGFDPHKLIEHYKQLEGTDFKLSDLDLSDEDHKFIKEIIQKISE